MNSLLHFHKPLRGKASEPRALASLVPCLPQPSRHSPASTSPSEKGSVGLATRVLSQCPQWFRWAKEGIEMEQAGGRGVRALVSREG